MSRPLYLFYPSGVKWLAFNNIALLIIVKRPTWIGWWHKRTYSSFPWFWVLTGVPGSPVPIGPGGPDLPWFPLSPWKNTFRLKIDRKVHRTWIDLFCRHNRWKKGSLYDPVPCKATLGPGNPLPLFPGGPGAPLSPRPPYWEEEKENQKRVHDFKMGT